MTGEVSMDGDLEHREVVAIRRAFYEGLGRTCLNAAWSHINTFRGNKDEFLGRPTPPRGVSQGMIAMAIDRSTGEVCRWLQGQSPQWANLMVVMLALDAGWSNLDGMPAKSDRKRGGYSLALLEIRRRWLGDTTKASKPPTAAELRGLEALFSHPQWEASRRLPIRRARLLKIVAEEQRVEESMLDAADRAWGEAFAVLQHAYLQSIDVALWR